MDLLKRYKKNLMKFIQFPMKLKFWDNAGSTPRNPSESAPGHFNNLLYLF